MKNKKKDKVSAWIISKFNLVVSILNKKHILLGLSTKSTKGENELTKAEYHMIYTSTASLHTTGSLLLPSSSEIFSDWNL